MAGLILCRTRYAERPYYINNMGVNIYSLEELCYYCLLYTSDAADE
mgnify:CR=1 FL=1